MGRVGRQFLVETSDAQSRSYLAAATVGHRTRQPVYHGLASVVLGRWKES